MDRQVDPRRPRVEGEPPEEVPREAPARALRRFWPVLLLAAALLLLVGCGLLPTAKTTQPPPASSLVVNFIDVGQGDSILVQSGGKSYLVDGGKPEAGPRACYELTREWLANAENED